MLTTALKTLSNPPSSPIVARRRAVADLNARISTLETELGIPHKVAAWNLKLATARLAALEKQLAAKSAAPIPSAAPSVELTGAGTLDRAIQASGVHNLRALKLKMKRDQFFAAAVNLPPGSVARECAEANLAKAQAELRNS